MQYNLELNTNEIKTEVASYRHKHCAFYQGCHRNCKSNSRTFLDDFPGLCKIFLQDLKFNFHYYSFMHPLFVLVIKENFNATHLDF